MIEDINNLKDDVRDYVEVRVDQLKLYLAESASRTLAGILKAIAITGLLFIIVLSLSIAAGYFLAELLDSTGLGFLCVAVFYIIVLCILLIFKGYLIERPVIKNVMRLFYPNTEDDETKEK